MATRCARRIRASRLGEAGGCAVAVDPAGASVAPSSGTRCATTGTAGTARRDASVATGAMVGAVSVEAAACSSDGSSCRSVCQHRYPIRPAAATPVVAMMPMARPESSSSGSYGFGERALGVRMSRTQASVDGDEAGSTRSDTAGAACAAVGSTWATGLAVSFAAGCWWAGRTTGLTWARRAWRLRALPRLR